MEFESRPDFEEVRARWERFWQGNVGQRPLFYVVLSKPGAGNSACRDWTDLHRRIDRVGKGQYFMTDDVGTLKRLCADLKRPNLFFDVKLQSWDEARGLIANVEAMSPGVPAESAR